MLQAAKISKNSNTIIADLCSRTPAVIKYRIESLKYEILQYYAGSDVNDLHILSSKRQQERLGILH